MKKFIPTLRPLMLSASSSCTDSEKTPGNGQKVQTVFQTESQKAYKGPEDLFTGEV